MTVRRTRARRLAIALSTLAIALLLVFTLGPAIVERHFNHIADTPHNPIRLEAKAIHAGLNVVDLHSDTLLWNRDVLERASRGHVDVPRLIEGNVAIQAFTIVTKTPRHQNIDFNLDGSDNITLLAILERWPTRTWSSLTERALFQATTLDEAARASNGRLTLLRTARDLDSYLLRRTSESSITAAFLGVEGAQALEGRLENLDRLFDAGIRMMAPTHFTDNDMGGSASGAEKSGLTQMGRALVLRMEEKHILIDLAHASTRTIDDLLAIAKRPVVVSHTGVRATCNNARNLDDEHLLGIAKTGGVIGIGYWPHAVCEASVAAIVRAIHHAVLVAGIDHVGLGSDFDGTTTTPFDTAGLAELTQGLLDEGFNEDQIRKLMGENTLRVLRATLPP
jgi:microsomal dipeptidase-like Zn-dependent dipeptidase